MLRWFLILSVWIREVCGKHPRFGDSKNLVFVSKPMKRHCYMEARLHVSTDCPTLLPGCAWLISIYMKWIRSYVLFLSSVSECPNSRPSYTKIISYLIPINTQNIWFPAFSTMSIRNAGDQCYIPNESSQTVLCNQVGLHKKIMKVSLFHISNYWSVTVLMASTFRIMSRLFHISKCSSICMTTIVLQDSTILCEYHQILRDQEQNPCHSVELH
jgi:hypothetical protein